jgi:putative membrane protein
MIQALVRWLVLTVAVWVAALIVPGIGYDNWQSLVVAALILGILNSLAKPALQVLSLPFIILTFGLFLLVVNAILLGLTARLVHGFWVSGFWPAAGGSLVISIVSMFLGYTGARRRVVIRRTETLFSDARRPPPGRGRVIDV